MMPNLRGIQKQCSGKTTRSCCIAHPLDDNCIYHHMVASALAPILTIPIYEVSILETRNIAYILVAVPSG